MGGGALMFAWGSYLFYLYKDQISPSTKIALYAQVCSHKFVGGQC